MDEVILRSFDEPDEVREFEKGRFETVRIGDLVIGRATYQPGWKWSEHVSLAGSRRHEGSGAPTEGRPYKLGHGKEAMDC
jgi:hypothetical protein